LHLEKGTTGFLILLQSRQGHEKIKSKIHITIYLYCLNDIYFSLSHYEIVADIDMNGVSREDYQAASVGFNDIYHLLSIHLH